MNGIILIVLTTVFIIVFIIGGYGIVNKIYQKGFIDGSKFTLDKIDEVLDTIDDTEQLKNKVYDYVTFKC